MPVCVQVNSGEIVYVQWDIAAYSTPNDRYLLLT